MVNFGLRVFIGCCLAAVLLILLMPWTIALPRSVGAAAWVLLTLVVVLLGEMAERLGRRIGEQLRANLVSLDAESATQAFAALPKAHVIHAKRWLRILLGIIIGAGAVPLAAVGVYGLGREVSRVPLNWEHVGSLLMLLGLGLAFAFVALRLMLVVDDAPLFGRWQRVVAEQLARRLADLRSRRRASLVGAAFLAAVSLTMILLASLDGSDEVWTYVATLAMAVLLWLRVWKRGNSSNT